MIKKGNAQDMLDLNSFEAQAKLPQFIEYVSKHYNPERLKEKQKL